MALSSLTPSDRREGLSVREREVLAGIHHAERRCEWIAARRLAKALLNRGGLLDADDSTISILPDDDFETHRPRVWRGTARLDGLDVSLAAASGWVAAALAVEARVGIDLVAPRETSADRLRPWLSDDERQTLAAESLHPVELWAMKEAAFKATSGEGDRFRPTELPVLCDRGWRCGGCAVLLVPLGRLTLALATDDPQLFRDPQRLLFERRRV